MDIHRLRIAWGRFSGWLAEHSPDDHAVLLPPATEEEIARIEEAHGFALHPELKELLRLQGGTPWAVSSPGFGTFLPGGHRLCDAQQIIGAHEICLDFHEDFPENWGDWWPEGAVVAHADRWVVFAEPNNGGMAFVDHAPGPTYGHVYEFGMGSGASDVTHWATSLTDLFNTLATAVETDTPFQGTHPVFLDFHRFDNPGFQHLIGKFILHWAYDLNALPPDADRTFRSVTAVPRE
ncbi:SMI1/KNR4 family protein [Actinocorallia aurantiaca]|uniref:Knr4/Smi1-like domain-containing protein n=1 Tax=Actinocorallia aurantiaca TaxID=46204 RepID=A0ABP6H1D5_9ACTN